MPKCIKTTKKTFIEFARLTNRHYIPITGDEPLVFHGKKVCWPCRCLHCEDHKTYSDYYLKRFIKRLKRKEHKNEKER